MDHGKEIVALAAKAAGIELACWDEVHHQWYRMTDDPEKVRQTGNGYGAAVFDPLDDDGDALRLAVKLDINVNNDMASGNWRYATYAGKSYASVDQDHCAAMRRAIVQAAADIGKAMP